MEAQRIVDRLRAELAGLDETPHIPIVFKESGKDDWCILSFRPFKHDHRPTWREAFDLAFTLSRVRHVTADTIKELTGDDTEAAPAGA